MATLFREAEIKTQPADQAQQPPTPGRQLGPMPGLAELQEQIAWAQRRHDLEMRLVMLAEEYDQALAHLQGIIRRYDDLLAQRIASEPAIRDRNIVPAELGWLLNAARRRARQQYPDLPVAS